MHLLHGLKATRPAGSNKLMVVAEYRPTVVPAGHGYLRAGDFCVSGKMLALDTFVV
jgi:hypothetical protein